jgi:two-component system CAI-1 autoinducer sensor kinase/phosphatase CqsS
MNAQIDYQLGNARLMDMPRERSVVDIGGLVASAVDSYPFSNRPMREMATISIESGLLGLVHKDILFHIVHNLLSNATKALARKGTALARSDIEVSVRRHRPGAIRLQVADRGDGIPADMLEKVFEPFQTSSHMPSHGLGLTMCKNAVTSFGGEVWCESTLGEGSTFIVELPEVTPSQIERRVLAR